MMPPAPQSTSHKLGHSVLPVLLGAVVITVATFAAWLYLHRMPREESGWTGIEACGMPLADSGSEPRVWPAALASAPPRFTGDPVPGSALSTGAATRRPAPDLNGLHRTYYDYSLPPGTYVVAIENENGMSFTLGPRDTLVVHSGSHWIWGC